MPSEKTSFSANARQLLKQSALFSHLNEQNLEDLLQNASKKDIRPRQVLFHKGDTGSQLFVVINGRIQISIPAEDGKEVTLAILEQGKIFGEFAVFDNQRRSATATALNASELLVIDRKQFIPFLHTHPQAAIEMIASLCERLRETDTFIEETLFLKLLPRLAKKISALAKQYGKKTENGDVFIDFKLTQGDLGNMLGISRESINRQMRIWQSEGLISFEEGYITIHDMDLLLLKSLTRDP